MPYLILATLGVLAFGDEPAVRSARSPRAFDQGRPHIVGATCARAMSSSLASESCGRAVGGAPTVRNLGVCCDKRRGPGVKACTLRLKSAIDDVSVEHTPPWRWRQSLDVGICRDQCIACARTARSSGNQGLFVAVRTSYCHACMPYEGHT